MPDDEIFFVISTFPNAEAARRVATELVTAKLAACANILPAVQSIYRWQGTIESAAETIVFFKTTAARFPALQERLRALHSYQIPEIVACKLADGLPEYLKWVRESCGH
jgi:periplasmic divalent cation tolerance protein